MAESIATTLLPETENKRRSSYRSIADTSFFSYFLDCVSSDLPPGGLLPLHHEAAVEPVNSNQLVMRALLDDLAVIDNEYFVGIAHGFQPMSNHDDGLILGQFGDGLHQFFFIFRVNIGRGLVQNDDRRVLQHGTGNGDALPLAAGQVTARRAAHGLIAVFKPHDKLKKSHYVSEDEWTIFENTHEAIIDQQTFDLVQKIRSNVRRYPNGWGEAAPLTGLLYCADCGGKMYVHRTNNGKRISQYTCSNYTKVPCGTLCPTQHRINESAVLTLVSDTLRAIAEYSRNDRTEFIHTVQETQVAQQSADISKKRRRLAAAQKRAGELEKLICKIYEDNALGKLPDARYRALDAQYAKEQDALEIEIAELEKAVTGYEQSQKSAEKFIALIDKYENFDTLTNTMLNEFVEKILVHERARKGSQDTTQEIEIYFNFLGRYIPPSLQPVPLTPEEQEELRKKEERKDRLHQNYLKRKASGAQKRYEDKIKAKKKAEMDAKKALIRAEDMKKGVFSTIGQLPKEEPRKGSIAASAAV